LSQLRLIKLRSGHAALLVNGHVVQTADPAFENPARVAETAKRLATALATNLEVTKMKAPTEEGWNWADICQLLIGSDGGYSPQGQCHCCTAPLLLDGYCSNDTCPYAKWPQRVSLIDLTLPEAEIISKYSIAARRRIAIEMHSDDRAFEAVADAAPWFVQAHDEDILELAECDWSMNHQADSIAWFLEESVPAVGGVTLYARNTQGSRNPVGFECQVDAESAIAWLEIHRRLVWAQVLCRRHGVVLFESDTAGREGLWGWVSSNGAQASPPTHADAAAAALNAVETLQLTYERPKALP
jgi:hypothetical protein